MLAQAAIRAEVTGRTVRFLVLGFPPLSAAAAAAAVVPLPELMEAVETAAAAAVLDGLPLEAAAERQLLGKAMRAA